MRRKSQGQSPRVHVFKGQHVQRKERTEPLPRTGSRADATEKKRYFMTGRQSEEEGRQDTGVITRERSEEKSEEVTHNEPPCTSKHCEDMPYRCSALLDTKLAKSSKLMAMEGRYLSSMARTFQGKGVSKRRMSKGEGGGDVVPAQCTG